MTIHLKKQGQDSIVMFLSGRFDITSALRLEQKIKPFLDGTFDIALDFKNLSGISSSGLYVLLHAYKAMNLNKRKLVIRNMNEPVRNVFETTGFISLIVEEKTQGISKNLNLAL
jgi:anti-anti-sigma factor